MTLRVALALAVFAGTVLQAKAADAQAPVWYWSEPLGAYYPYVARCPAPWRRVDPQRPNTTTPQPSPPTGGTPHPSAIGEPTPLLSTATPDNSAPSGGTLDEWCAKVKLPSNITICSDPDLRALMIERQHAYDEANGRLTPEQRKALLVDQNGWVKSYPQACGLVPDAPPALQLTGDQGLHGTRGAGAAYLYSRLRADIAGGAYIGRIADPIRATPGVSRPHRPLARII